MRYIIALLAQYPNFFIQEAQKEFAGKHETYLLSENSLPHITLAQFNLENPELLSKIWDELHNKIVHIPQPKFLGLNFSKKSKNLWGVSLTVERSIDLVRLHNLVVGMLVQYNVKCLNQTEESYRPHLTLARIKELKIESFNDKLLDEAPFVLAIGQSDQNGQFLKVIFRPNDNV